MPLSIIPLSDNSAGSERVAGSCFTQNAGRRLEDGIHSRRARCLLGHRIAEFGSRTRTLAAGAGGGKGRGRGPDSLDGGRGWARRIVGLRMSPLAMNSRLTFRRRTWLLIRVPPIFSRAGMKTAKENEPFFLVTPSTPNRTGSPPDAPSPPRQRVAAEAGRERETNHLLRDIGRRTRIGASRSRLPPSMLLVPGYIFSSAGRNTTSHSHGKARWFFD